MRKMCVAIVVLSAGLTLAQDSANNQPEKKNPEGTVTVQGCVSRSSGDYILMKQNPAMSYELQGSHKIKLRNYLGQRVEVTANESPTMSSSSDAMNKTGSAAPTTLTVTSIKTIDKDCTVR